MARKKERFPLWGPHIKKKILEIAVTLVLWSNASGISLGGWWFKSWRIHVFLPPGQRLDLTGVSLKMTCLRGLETAKLQYRK